MNSDVSIVGGGLAGLTLALQLRQRNPELSITVFERRRHPLPEAGHKVGESTVEIGAQYLARTLGLRDYLGERQLRKYGLRFFFGADGDSDLARADELGPSHLLRVPSYQLDRGRLENDLARMARTQGIAFCDDSRVTGVALSEEGAPHRLTVESQGTPQEVKSRWIVDSASRASPLKRQLQLGRPNDHGCDAAWFRIDTRIAIDDWSDNPDWQARGPDEKRWLSTNHLMGPGYWVWLIPLSSGTTSIGIVADPELHPLDSYNSLDKALAWLERHEPRCAAAIREGGARTIDFLFLRHYSHDCRQVFGANRWALSGEAGVFLDPFYSPGSDFIAIANTMITDLIERDLRGESIDGRRRQLEQIYFSFYRSTLSLYQNQYPGFGDQDLMVAKINWDYAYYWGVLALIFCQGRITDLALYERMLPVLGRAQIVNRKLQDTFRSLAAPARRKPARGRFYDQCRMPLMCRLNAGLLDDLSSAELDERLTANVATLERLGPALAGCAAGERPDAWLTEQMGPAFAGSG